MKAKLSIAFEELKGKAGTVVGKGSMSGQIIMQRSVGRDRRTQGQIRSRMLLTQLSKKWELLTQEQRDTWNAAAGSKRSGYDLFCERNTNLNSISRPFIEVFTESTAFTGSVAISEEINFSERTFFLKIRSFSYAEDERVLVKISQFTPRLMSADTYKFRNLWSGEMLPQTSENLWSKIVNNSGRTPADGDYFVLEYSYIKRNSGEKMIVGRDTLIWGETVQPYIPNLVWPNRPEDYDFDTSRDSGTLTIEAPISNYKENEELTVEASYTLYKNADKTEYYIRNRSASPWIENGIFGLSESLDGGEFDATPAEGATLYLEVKTEITVTSSGQTYTAYSPIYECTAE